MNFSPKTHNDLQPLALIVVIAILLFVLAIPARLSKLTPPPQIVIPTTAASRFPRASAPLSSRTRSVMPVTLWLRRTASSTLTPGADATMEMTSLRPAACLSLYKIRLAAGTRTRLSALAGRSRAKTQAALASLSTRAPFTPK